MKKTIKKFALKKEVIRELTGTLISAVHGGGSNDWTCQCLPPRRSNPTDVCISDACGGSGPPGSIVTSCYNCGAQ